LSAELTKNALLQTVFLVVLPTGLCLFSVHHLNSQQKKSIVSTFFDLFLVTSTV